MVEKIIVVNDKDEVIGIKDRNSICPGDIYRLSTLWLTNSAGDVLIAKRALTKKSSAGKWTCAVAGTVAEGETYDDNIVKEIREELGISLTLEQLGVGGKIRVNGDGRSYFVQWYLYTSDAPISTYTIDPSEASEIKWINKNELREWVATSPQDFSAGFLISFPEIIGR